MPLLRLLRARRATYAVDDDGCRHIDEADIR